MFPYQNALVEENYVSIKMIQKMAEEDGSEVRVLIIRQLKESVSMSALPQGWYSLFLEPHQLFLLCFPNFLKSMPRGLERWLSG